MQPSAAETPYMKTDAIAGNGSERPRQRGSAEHRRVMPSRRLPRGLRVRNVSKEGVLPFGAPAELRWERSAVRTAENAPGRHSHREPIYH